MLGAVGGQQTWLDEKGTGGSPVKTVIIRNIKTGQEERANPEAAKRLKDSKYADAFEFREITDPPEAMAD
jgi:hypothetical protein